MASTYVLLGDPVAASLSPIFQNAALKAAGIDARYEARQVDKNGLIAEVEKIRRRETAGANVTIPHKLRALALCDVITAEARQVGAANWMGLAPDGKIVGDNTDARGLAAALFEAGFAIPGGTAVVFGAGGGARAAIVALRRAGARRIFVGARRADEATALADAIGSPVVVGGTLAQAHAEAADADALASAVPAAAWNDVAPPSARSGAFLLDLAYGKPGEPTAAETWSRAKGLRAVGGISMLLHQGALSFEAWTGVPFPMAAARAAIGL